MSKRSEEERVLENHRSDVLKAIVHPLMVTQRLIQDKVVSPELVHEVESSVNRTVTEKNSAILKAVSASVRADPSRIHVFLAVLETQVEAAPLARRMRGELEDQVETDSVHSRASVSKWAQTREEKVVKANPYVVDRLQQLQFTFSSMLTKLRDPLHYNSDVAEISFFLNDLFDTDEYDDCNTITKTLIKLRKNRLDTFNTHSLECLAKESGKDSMKKLVNDYILEKDQFLQDTSVVDFHKLVFNKAEPVLPEAMKEITILIPTSLANTRTLKDMETLTWRAFGEYRNSFVTLNVRAGSIYVCWFFPDQLTTILQKLAKKKESVFTEAGVKEVVIAGDVVFLDFSFPVKQFLEQNMKHITSLLDFGIARQYLYQFNILTNQQMKRTMISRLFQEEDMPELYSKSSSFLSYREFENVGIIMDALEKAGSRGVIALVDTLVQSSEEKESHRKLLEKFQEDDNYLDLVVMCELYKNRRSQ